MRREERRRTRRAGGGKAEARPRPSGEVETGGSTPRSPGEARTDETANHGGKPPEEDLAMTKGIEWGYKVMNEKIDYEAGWNGANTMEVTRDNLPWAKRVIRGYKLSKEDRRELIDFLTGNLGTGMRSIRVCLIYRAVA